MLLLVRRVVVYLANRFPFVNEEGKEYAAGRSPRVVISAVFANWQVFHEAYPKGAKATALLPEALSQEEPEASSQEAAQELQHGVHVCRLPSRAPEEDHRIPAVPCWISAATSKGLLWNSVQKDVNMTGEVFMGQQEFKGDGVFDFEELVQDGAGLGYEFGVAGSEVERASKGTVEHISLTQRPSQQSRVFPAAPASLGATVPAPGPGLPEAGAQ